METTAIRERITARSAETDGTVSVCLIGQTYWADKLKGSLNAYGRSQLQASTLLLNRQFLRGVKQSLSADVIVSVGFRPGAPTWRGRAFDALWSSLRTFNPSATRVFYWLGTDVLNTCEDFKAGRLRRASHARAKKDHHLADATWLVEELQLVDIQALHKTVTVPDLVVDDAPDLPPTFSVLTYIPDGRYRFYGGDAVYQTARDLPEVRFDVVGGCGTWVPAPLPNLVFHGWQSDMTSFHRRASVLVRLVQHDGTGLTALEGLSLGRHVVYSHPLPHTIRVPWDDAHTLIQTVAGLFDLHQRGLLRSNTAGSAYVQKNFNHHHCMEDLVRYFIDVSSDRQSGRQQSNER